MTVAVVAFGAISALGEGDAAVYAGSVGEPARVAITKDDELAKAGLTRPFVARASAGDRDGESLAPASEDRATVLLRRAVTGCAAELDRVLPGWRKERIGLAIGTSSGGLRTAERVFDGLAAGRAPSAHDAASALYFAPMHQAVSPLRIPFEPSTLVLGACAASTLAIGLGMRWLDEGACDLVLAGGFDAVSIMVAAGFEVLRATTGAVPPRPFRMERDGMSLGEGAAVVALRSTARVKTARGYVAGFGASSDAVHLTAPDRTGSGLARAATAALAEAGNPTIDLVSAHATATPFNDAAEARAMKQALGEGASAPVVHPFKAQIGHTLGAAGALETLSALDCLNRGVLPAAAGSGPLDADAPARLLDVGQVGDPKVALKLSAAFGGANAVLVVSGAPLASRPRARRDVFLGPAVHIAGEPDLANLAAASGLPSERVARADRLTRYALAATAALAAAHGPLAGAGVVVGQAFATLETDALFHRRIAERGARMAEPRRFPYTSPNAASGDCGVAFGLTGPGFGVGAGLHAGLEALIVGVDLVRQGDVDRVVVVAVDDTGPVAEAITAKLGILAPRAGAVGVLVSASPEGAVARITGTFLRLSGDDAPPGSRAPPGHLALLPLLQRPLPRAVVATSPPVTTEAGLPLVLAARATVELEPLP